MNKLFSLIAFGMLCSLPAFAQQEQFPVVKSFGGVYHIPEAVRLPDSTLHYKIVVDIRMGSEDPAYISPALHNLARMLNLHALGGVPPERMEVVAVIHSTATHTILSDKDYRKKYKKDNPNLPLLKELREAGVDLYVCGQSLIARDCKEATLSPDVKISIAALTILTECQLNGYALLSF